MKQLVHRLSSAIMAILIFSGFTSAQFQMQKIKDSGSTATKVNLVILGDGYTSSELSKFWSDAQTVTTGVFNTYPYNGSISSSFNVFAVGVISQASGAGASPSQPINNYFGSTFYADGVTQRLLYPTKGDLAFSTAASYVPEYDHVIVMVNTSTYGGGGGALATISTHPDAINLFVHEFGHSFGDLQDEYWNGGPGEAPNMTQNGGNPRWSQYIGQSGVGVYPHEENSSWYRPHQNCKMRFLAGGFDLVCANRLIEKTNSITGGCTSTAITPYIQVNGGTWQQTSSVTVSSGATVKFGPQPSAGGSWNWSGCGTSGTAREQTFTATSSCTATATYTNSGGCQSTQAFTVTVNGGGCTSAPAIPSALSASGQKVSWNSVAGATSYTLQRWTGSAWVTAATPTTNSATLSLTGDIYFQVSATNSCGTSAFSAYVLLTLTSGGGGCTSAPATPDGLAASAQTVSWNSVAGATNYTLQRWTGSAWVTAATPSTNSATLSLTGDNYFQVSATNSCGTSAFSAYVLLTLTSGGGCTSAPATPGGLAASAQTVSWNSVTGATSYTLQRWTGSAWVTAATPTSNSATLSLTGGNYFQVSATNSCGTSAYSAYAYLTLVAPPPVESEERLVGYYPNPTSGLINIRNPFGKEAVVKVYNTSGALVGEHKLPPSEGIVDISPLINGEYLFHIVRGAKKAPAFRVIKK